MFPPYDPNSHTNDLALDARVRDNRAARAAAQQRRHSLDPFMGWDVDPGIASDEVAPHFSRYATAINDPLPGAASVRGLLGAKPQLRTKGRM